MDSSYEWVSFGKCTPNEGNLLIGVNNIIDIMGAPISDENEFREEIIKILKPYSTLCISGELKEYMDGQPASNYRFNGDDILNENVIQNYFYLFREYSKITHKPIIVTTIPRQWRKYSWYFTEEGKLIREDQDFRKETNPGGMHYYTGFPGGCETAEDIEDTQFTNMLYKFGICSEKIKVIRESCKGSKYNSYMIDMISFLYQLYIQSPQFHNIFKSEYRNTISVMGGEEVGKWKPKEDMNYLYFEKCLDEDGYVFFVPQKESIDHIYHLLELVLLPFENKIKKMIRDHLSKFSIDRWSDFDANDTDDAFTILMIIHAYTCDNESGEPISLSEGEYKIKKNLESIMEPWFQRLNSTTIA